MKTTTTTKKNKAKMALIDLAFQVEIPKGATGVLVKRFAADQAPNLKSYPNFVNMTSSGSKTKTAIVKFKKWNCWVPANKLQLA
jgi:hypothetical protein